MKGIIDRFENNYAVVEIEIGKTVLIPREIVKEAEEQDIIEITIKKQETKKRKEAMKKLMDQVFEDENEIR